MVRRQFSLVLVALLTSVATAQGSWRDRYEASEMMIPMRDGTKLYTVAFVPKDRSTNYPILMERTPYGAGSPMRAPQRNYPKLNEAGYILVFQDVRGQGKSEGDFVNVRPMLKPGQPGFDESTDTFDTIDYLIKNIPANNQKVGMWGISYPGFYAGAGAVRGHPALAAVSPQAPVNDWFLGDDVHHNGTFFLQESFDFAIGFDVPRGQPRISLDRGNKTAYQFFLDAGPLSTYDAQFLQGRLPYWNELIENDTYNEYWKDRALSRSLKGVTAAVLTVGGWFDKEDMYGALQLYRAGEKQNPKSKNFLVMGPWSHGQWAGGDAQSLGGQQWGSRTGQWYQENIELPFFEKFLKGKDTGPEIAEASIFETGANVWHQYSQWPPKGTKAASLHLGTDGTISFNPSQAVGSVGYVADPANPTPYVEDWKTSRRAPGDWLARNQRFLTERSDQVSFSTEPLEKAVRIAGPVEADLWITTTGTDADLVVQLIDVEPGEGGRHNMVRGNIMRAKFRNSFEKPAPLVPGTPTRVRFQLNDAAHTFKPGHRILVRVMSSWFPIADRNPNTFVSRIAATQADFVSANIQVLLGPKTPSQIRVMTLPEPKTP